MNFLLLFLCSGLTFLKVPIPATPFELVDEEEGIQLYERWHKTADGRPYRELKTILRVKANTHELIRTLREEPLAKKWMRRVDNVRS
ncbi:MAG: hypothetical protein KI786_17080, partial [Mameliella sp.]|nr:hypothetical protein [Phaeodactylibacter sp.]